MRKNILLMIIISTIVAVSCKSGEKSFAYGFLSKDDLIQKVFFQLSREKKHIKKPGQEKNSGNDCRLSVISYFTISQREFHDLLYPHLPEKGTIPEADYWYMVHNDTIKSLAAAMDVFPGARLVNIGNPAKKVQYGPLIIHRDIPVTVEFPSHVEGVPAIRKTYPDLFKAVVEINGVYRLWNFDFD